MSNATLLERGGGEGSGDKAETGKRLVPLSEEGPFAEGGNGGFGAQ